MSVIENNFTEETLKDCDVYVSKKVWATLSTEVKIELIALSRMTGEKIQDELNDEEQFIYDSAMGFEE